MSSDQLRRLQQRAKKSKEKDEEGGVLISGSLDGTVKVWLLEDNTQRAECVATLSGHHDHVYSLCSAAAPTQRQTGLRFLSGSNDSSIRLWQPAVSGSNKKNKQIQAVGVR